VPTPLRAALLVAWGTSFLHGGATVDRVVRLVEDADEPHHVHDTSADDARTLGEALLALRQAGWGALRLALPEPGDPLGLVGPPATNERVLAAGEAAIGVPLGQHADSAGTVPALVPQVSTFGPPGDEGHLVAWQVLPARRRQPDIPDRRQAERELTAAIQETTEALGSLDGALWAADTGDAARRVRGGARPLLLPDDAGPGAEMLAQQALTVLRILDAAPTAGDALTSHTAVARQSALAPLRRAARRALVAAVSPEHLTVSRHASVEGPRDARQR
jgi:hypothetical protein